MGFAYKSIEREITMLIFEDCKYAQYITYKKRENGHRISYFKLCKNSDNFTIWNLGTTPRYRNKGNAQRMLREFIEQFDFSKPLILYVEKTNEIAIHLYKKVGFKIVGDYYGGDFTYEMRYERENNYDKRENE